MIRCLSLSLCFYFSYGGEGSNMEGILKELYNEIAKINTVEEFKSKTFQYMNKLNESGLSEIAKEIRSLSGFYENKFSKVSTLENMQQSKVMVLNYIEEQIFISSQVSDNIDPLIVKKILKNFHLFCKSLYKDPIHGKCSDALKNNLPNVEIMNEYDDSN